MVNNVVFTYLYRGIRLLLLLFKILKISKLYYFYNTFVYFL